jgi:hypothetical protein
MFYGLNDEHRDRVPRGRFQLGEIAARHLEQSSRGDCNLNQGYIEGILRDFSRLDDPNADSVIGRVVNGPAGSGKTHLLGTLRRRVWERHGWFILLDIVGIKDFWRTACLGFIRSLRQPLPDGRSQYQAVFETALHRVPAEKRKAIISSYKNLEGGGDRHGESLRQNTAE